jgi:2-keto-4-pentenoate hydratase
MGLSYDQIENAASLLIEARRSGKRIAGLPESVRPASADEAHDIQDAVRRALGEDASAIKVTAAKSGDVFRGILPSSACGASPAVFPASSVQIVGIEAEIAFRFPTGLAPQPEGYEADVVAAAAEACAAFDIVGSHFDDFMSLTPFERAADNLNAGAFVSSNSMANWRSVDFKSLSVTVWVDGVELFRGAGGHPAGDAFIPVLAYAHTVRREGLKAGTIITTGSFCGLLPIRPGQVIRAQLGPFDPVEVTIAVPTNN